MALSSEKDFLTLLVGHTQTKRFLIVTISFQQNAKIPQNPIAFFFPRDYHDPADSFCGKRQGGNSVGVFGGKRRERTGRRKAMRAHYETMIRDNDRKVKKALRIQNRDDKSAFCGGFPDEDGLYHARYRCV